MRNEDVAAEVVEAVNAAISPLAADFAKFKDQYDLDMRGDTDAGNGHKGIVNEIRAINKHIGTYPSITYLLRHKFKETVAIIFGVGILQFIAIGFIISIMGWTGILTVLLKTFGIPAP